MLRAPQSLLHKVIGLITLLISGWLLIALWQALNHLDLMSLPGGHLIGVPVPELAIWSLILFFGGGATLTFVIGFEKLGLSVKRSHALLAWTKKTNWETQGLVILTILSVTASTLIRSFVLRGQPVSDDELTYETIARTLQLGRLSNPAAPQDLPFIASQFIVTTTNSWYGKYPIGHPLVLVLGLLFHNPYVPIALMNCATCFATWSLGRHWFGPRRAMLALFFLALSPHFVFTFATLASQTTTTFCLMTGLYALNAAASRPSLVRFFFAGLIFGLGALARPAPSALFAAGGALLLIMSAVKRQTRWPSVFAFITPLVGAASVLLLVNHLQSGDPTRSGYIAVHGGYGQFGDSDGQIGFSVMGAIIREAFWLAGSPLLFLLIPLARLRRSRTWLGSTRSLVLGALACELVYRIVVPKTVVSSTGPIYVTETVPLLCVLLSDGVWRITRMARRVTRVKNAQVGISMVVAGLLLSFTTVIPLALMSLHRGAAEREIFFEAVAETRASSGRPIVVFSQVIIADLERTWAAYAPNRDPASPFDADPLILTTLDLPAMHALMARRFPNRRAYFWTVESGRGELLPLSEFGRPRSNASGVRGLTGPPPSTD